MNKLAKISIMQIMILVIGIVAIGWALGSGVGVVSGGKGLGESCTDNTQCDDSSKKICINSNTKADVIIIAGCDNNICVEKENVIQNQVNCPNGCENGECLEEITFTEEEAYDGGPGQSCGDGGTCIEVNIADYGTYPCKEKDGHNCIDPSKINGKSCGDGGTFQFGLCQIPDYNGDGKTTVCCVSKDGAAPEGTDEEPECGPDKPCTGEDMECKNGECIPKGDGQEVPIPSNLANLMTFGLYNPIKNLFSKDGNETDKSKSKYLKESIGAGVMWAGIAAGASQWLAPMAGAGAGATTAFTAASSAGMFSGFLTKGIIGAGAGYFWAPFAGVIVATTIFMLTYKEHAEKKKRFTSNPWEAPPGGDHCEECNDGVFGCSEYQCRSLGQACEIINEGSSEEMCVWMNRHDTNPPEIQPWKEALLNQDYSYIEETDISPPDRGVYINYAGKTSKGFDGKIGCAEAFTPFSFGINVNEPAKCKLDYDELKQNFSSMGFDFGGSSTAKYNHSQTMSLPGPSSEGNLTLENDGEFSIYVKCQDANGIENVGSFAFKFCVNDGPDSTPPLIITTDPLSGFPFAFNVVEVDVNLYLNEPAECRWSHLDETYEDMETNHPNQHCDTGSSVANINAQMMYPCSPMTLDGLNDGVENKFYIRCKDYAKPDRMTNIEPYEYILVGSKELVITDVGPDETIKDSTDSVKISLTATTFAGFDEGKSNCYYSTTGNEQDYVAFFEDNNYDNVNHAQELWLEEGTYTYYIKCVDLAGNSDYAETSFEVDTDTDEPIVVRVYHEENFLKVITDEEAECVYDNVDCTYDFADGLAMNVYNKVDHFVDWNSDLNYYIKCKDTYGNEPSPDKCSIIARPFEIHMVE